jgi:hypothetical protein
MLVIAALVLLSQGALAQHTACTDTSASDRAGRSGAEIWTGYSGRSTSADFLGRHSGITLTLVGLRWNCRISTSGSRSLYYTFDVIPIARVSPLIVYSTTAADRCQAPNFDCERVATVARGVGVNPLGITRVYHTDRVVQWRLGATGGLLVFDRPTPSDLASRFNFTAAIEGGVQLVRRNGGGVLIVYRLHHLSNGGQAQDNLAMLSHVFSIGGRWLLTGGEKR